jgi:chitin synthase
MKSVVFRNIVVSLLATYGLYIVSSLLAFDPWHLRELSTHSVD